VHWIIEEGQNGWQGNSRTILDKIYLFFIEFVRASLFIMTAIK